MDCTVTVLHLRKFLDEVSTHLHHYRKYLHGLDSHKDRFIACIPFTIEGHEDDFTIYNVYWEGCLSFESVLPRYVISSSPPEHGYQLIITNDYQPTHLSLIRFLTILVKNSFYLKAFVLNNNCSMPILTEDPPLSLALVSLKNDEQCSDENQKCHTYWAL